MSAPLEKSLKRKKAIIDGLKRKEKSFTNTLAPHLRELSKVLADNVEEPDLDQLLTEHDEYLWEITEVLFVSLYHWYEQKVRFFLFLQTFAPDDLDGMSMEELEDHYKAHGIHLGQLKSAQKVRTIKLTANSIKHNGRKPSPAMLKVLDLKDPPIYPGGFGRPDSPTSYYGILTSPAIQHALMRKFGRSPEALSENPQLKIVEAAMGHLRIALEDLIRRLPDDKWKRGRRATLWPPQV